MKKLLFLPLFLLAIAAVAQQTSGALVYKRTISFDKTQFANSNLPEDIAAAFPDEQQSEQILYFSPEASLYAYHQSSQKEQPSYTEGNMMIQMSDQASEEVVYVDLKNKIKTEQKDLMGKLFLVESKGLPEMKWKPTGRQKKILGMPCMEAQLIQIDKPQQDTDAPEVSAWYTTSIPVSTGPEGMYGLPGMIMELSVGNQIHLVATSISPMNATFKKQMKVPVKGKKISAEAYTKLSQQKMEQMRRQYGGKGNVILKVERR